MELLPQILQDHSLQALQLFDLMLTAYTFPNAFAYSCAIKSCEQGSQWQQALRFFGAMVNARVKADAISYGGAASACAQAVQWRHALLLLQTMRES